MASINKYEIVMKKYTCKTSGKDSDSKLTLPQGIMFGENEH